VKAVWVEADWSALAENDIVRHVEDGVTLIGFVTGASETGLFMVVPEADGPTFHFAARERGILYSEGRDDSGF
jgi:hypothetical protein